MKNDNEEVGDFDNCLTYNVKDKVIIYLPSMNLSLFFLSLSGGGGEGGGGRGGGGGGGR